MRIMITLAVLMALFLTGCDLTKKSSESTTDEWGRPLPSEALQMQAAKAHQAELNVAQENIKRLAALQFQVVEACVKRGSIPVLLNGNVDCKPAPQGH